MLPAPEKKASVRPAACSRCGARALLRGAYAPSAQDIADLAPAVLNHRMALAFGARARGITQLELIGDVTQMILDKKAAS